MKYLALTLLAIMTLMIGCQTTQEISESGDYFGITEEEAKVIANDFVEFVIEDRIARDTTYHIYDASKGTVGDHLVQMLRLKGYAIDVAEEPKPYAVPIRWWIVPVGDIKQTPDMYVRVMIERKDYTRIYRSDNKNIRSMTQFNTGTWE